MLFRSLLFDRRPEWEATSKGIVLREPARSGAPPLQRALGRLCRDCLAQNPTARPANAIEVSAMLTSVEAGRSRQSSPLFRRPPPRWMVLVGAALAALVLTGLLGHRRLGPPEPGARQVLETTPADRLFLRALADRMSAEGRLADARTLNRLAGPVTPR